MNFARIVAMSDVILRGHILNWFWRDRVTRRAVRSDVISRVIPRYFKRYLPAAAAVVEQPVVKDDKNEKILKELVEEKRRLDELSEVISENDDVREAIKIYDLKTKEKINIESKISEIDAQLSQVNSSKDLKIQINTLLNELDQLFGEKNAKINLYREFVYNLVTKIYGEDRNPYLNIGPTESKQKYKAMPISIDLSFDGDTGEGLTSAKYLIFDFLIMNYTKYVDFLIEDSSCFESIDRRQIVNLILEGKKISHLTNKQFIISLNKYLLDDNDIIKDDIVISLSENDTLLNIKF